jgi:hypothetical protein
MWHPHTSSGFVTGSKFGMIVQARIPTLTSNAGFKLTHKLGIHIFVMNFLVNRIVNTIELLSVVVVIYVAVVTRHYWVKRDIDVHSGILAGEHATPPRESGSRLDDLASRRQRQEVGQT